MIDTNKIKTGGRCDRDEKRSTKRRLSLYVDVGGLAQTGLTRRELECCNRLIFGYSASQIAQELKISVRTAEHYINSLKLKLHCTSKYNLSEQLRKKLNISVRNIANQLAAKEHPQN